MKVVIIVIFILALAMPRVVDAQNFENCAYHAYKLCQGNNVFWYDSCGNRQDLFYACSGNQTCKYGVCVPPLESPSPEASPTISPNQPAAISVAATTPGFWGFLKKWYSWISIILVLIFLFIIIFKRLSSEA